MAARRGKSQARRNQSNGLPGWAWLVIGVVLTLLVVVLAMRYLKPSSSDSFLRVGPTPNPNAQPAPAHGDAIAPDVASDAPKAATDAQKPTRYDFYTLLPGEGVQMTDAELAASAKAEADARAKEAQRDAATATAATTATGSALPTPLDDAAATATTPTPAATREPATDAANAGNDSSARYLLQAGAFGASGDAESLKARIAMLGLSARVESAQIGDKTVYRVRMGPYGTASELASAKAKLAGGGLPAMAIKAK